jgi:hypothetical protein
MCKFPGRTILLASLISMAIFLVGCKSKSISARSEFNTEVPVRTISPTPTATPFPTVTAIPYIVETLSPLSEKANMPPLNPPEYQAEGRLISEVSQTEERDAYYRSIYDVFYRDVGRSAFYPEGLLSGQEVYEQVMNEYARDKGLQVFQSKSSDGLGIVSFPVKNNGDGTWSMWWFATSEGAFSAQPDIPSTTDSIWTEIVVDGQIGGDWGEDGNFYVFQLNEQTEAEAWFSPAESVVGNLMWREVVKAEVVAEQPVASAELLELAAKYPLVENWQEADRCEIPWELVKEGIPGKIARLEGQPFPETAYNTGRIYYVGDEDYAELSWDWWSPSSEDIDYRSNPETRPYRWVGFCYTIDDDNHERLVAVQQWLNPSGKISYLTYVGAAFVDERLVPAWQSMAVGWPIVEWNGTRESDEYCDDVNNQDWCDMAYDSDKTIMLKQWQETGEIPDELENKPLEPMIDTHSVYLPITE